MKQLFRRIPRKLRFFLDISLTLLLLLAIAAVVGIPTVGDEARFRRIEKAGLAGPSEILDLISVSGEWSCGGYDRLLLADAGEEILFYPYFEHGYGTLYRREKTDGILMTPAPNLGILQRGGVLPLFLFVDNPAAVKAEVTLHLSNTREIELQQARGPDTPPEERNKDTRAAHFQFILPVPENPRSAIGHRLQMLSETNHSGVSSRHVFPAVIRLHDASGTLLETREYVIRSRAMDAHAEE